MIALQKLDAIEHPTQLDRVVYASQDSWDDVDSEAAAQELLDLRARLAKAEELLKRAEWEGGEERHYTCPLCGAFREHGHEWDCELAAFLKGIK